MSTSSDQRPRRRYDNSRRRAEAEARQRRIVEAATALFVEQGFGATSIDQIAAAADVSPQTIYATYGSKAGVLSRAIDVAVRGDFTAVPVMDLAPVLAEVSGSQQRVHFVAAARFARAMHERVAPLMRILEQATATDPALTELRTRLLHEIREDMATWAAQLGPNLLRPGLTESQAADVLFTIQSPWVYSVFTVDLGWSPDDYEQWLAHALPHMLLRPELLSD